MSILKQPPRDRAFDSEPLGWVILPYGTIQCHYVKGRFEWTPDRDARQQESYDEEATAAAADYATTATNPPVRYSNPGDGVPGIAQIEEVAETLDGEVKLGKIQPLRKIKGGVDGAELYDADHGDVTKFNGTGLPPLGPDSPEGSPEGSPEEQNLQGYGQEPITPEALPESLPTDVALELVNIARGDTKVLRGSQVDGFIEANLLGGELSDALAKAVGFLKVSSKLNDYNNDNQQPRDQELDGINRTIDAAISLAPPLEIGVSAFRIIGPKIKTKYKEGDSFIEKRHLCVYLDADYARSAFTSYTADAYTANAAIKGVTLVQIRIPDGAKILYVTKPEGYDRDHEALLPRNSLFNIVAVQKIEETTFVLLDYILPHENESFDRTSPPIDPAELTDNIFCPTGKGGGIKPDCKGDPKAAVAPVQAVKAVSAHPQAQAPAPHAPTGGAPTGAPTSEPHDAPTPRPKDTQQSDHREEKSPAQQHKPEPKQESKEPKPPDKPSDKGPPSAPPEVKPKSALDPATTMKDIAFVHHSYNAAAPDKKLEILKAHDMKVELGKLTTTEEFRNHLIRRAETKLNPEPITDLIKKSAERYETTRKEIAVLADKHAEIEHQRQEIAEKLAPLGLKDPQRGPLETQRYNLLVEQEKLGQEARAIINKSLRQANGDQGHPVNKETLKTDTPALNENVKAARDFLDRIVRVGPDGKQLPPSSVEWVPGVRPNYDPNYKRIQTKIRDIDATVHEYGHHIEHNVPGAQKAAQDFLAHRVGNEKETDLRQKYPDAGYHKGDLGKKNDFEKATGEERRAYYVGKTYEDGATEVISMGIEMMHKDPIRFAKNDPEFFHFTMGILSGETRRRSLPGD